MMTGHRSMPEKPLPGQSRREIVVLAVALDSVPEPAWPELEVLLDASERQRAARFHLERHRRQYVAAHALKRMMLSAMTGACPRSWSFELAPGGKPRVRPEPGPYFNLSHCDGLVACAVSRDLDIGVDVEPLSPDAPLALVQSHFAAAERRWLDGLPATDRPEGFFALWTLKEAFLKATGYGLAQPLHRFAVDVDRLGVAFDDPLLGDPAAWHFAQYRVNAQHILGLAWLGADAGILSGMAPAQVLLDRSAAGLTGFEGLVAYRDELPCA